LTVLIPAWAEKEIQLDNHQLDMWVTRNIWIRCCCIQGRWKI